MANFQRGPSIRLNSVMGGYSRRRIYPNDNLTPDASRLVYLNRQLLSSKKLVKNNLINGIVPKIKDTIPDGSVKILTLQECVLGPAAINLGHYMLLCGLWR